MIYLKCIKKFEFKRLIILNFICYHQNQHYDNIYVNTTHKQNKLI